VAHTGHAGNFLGLALVGLCATLLGGCPLRQLVLSGNGNADAAVTVLGMLAGAALAHNFGLAKLVNTNGWGFAAVILGLVAAVAIAYVHRK
jgi:YedE family putative selenium metabolism protein